MIIKILGGGEKREKRERREEREEREERRERERERERKRERERGREYCIDIFSINFYSCAMLPQDCNEEYLK